MWVVLFNNLDTLLVGGVFTSVVAVAGYKAGRWVGRRRP